MDCMPSKFLPLFFLLHFLLLIILVSLVLCAWGYTTDYASKILGEFFGETQSMLLEMIHAEAQILSKMNTSTLNLARNVGTSLQGNLSSFSTIEKQVAPALFLAYSTIPWVSQALYVGKDGLFFSYYSEGNRHGVIFSNASWFSSYGNSTHGDAFNHSSDYHWYQLLLHEDTGILHGDAMEANKLIAFSSDWIDKALQQNNMYITVGPGVNDVKDVRFLFVAPVTHQGLGGVISLGVSADVFMAYSVHDIDLQNGGLYVARNDGHILAQRGLPYTNFLLDSAEMLEESSDFTCNPKSYPFLISNSPVSTIKGKLYKFRCAPINVGDIQLVSILVLPCKGISHYTQDIGIAALIGLVVMLILVGFASCFMYQLIRKFQNNELFLCASLIRYKEATQQAERKSMNKSLAFASASHDIRTSLATITGLIELCRGLVSPYHDLHKNFDQMDVCASKLLGILNSVLDISKIEAGKMQLEEIEFNMAQVLEESVDLFHVVALRKGLELIWDPCDFSVLESLNVKGDCRRLKQILDNLLGNAVKFTAEGHVVVRCSAKKVTLQNVTSPIDRACQFSNIMNPITHFFCKSDSTYNKSRSLHLVHQDPNCIEFMFEVDDSGIGIPKEKRDSVFENYVQVKDSSYGGEAGTGLGLGIVQSYVRLMGGEIGIINKKDNEKGTCFRFNIILKSVESSVSLGRENSAPFSVVTEKESSTETPKMVEAFKKGLKQDGVHVLVVHLIHGEETRKIFQRWMDNLGVKTWAIDKLDFLNMALEKVKLSLKSGYFNGSGKYDFTSNKVYSDHTLVSGRSEAEIPPSMKDTFNHNFLRRTISRSSLTHVVVIVDMSYHPILEILSSLNNFVKGLNQNQYKIVWLVDRGKPYEAGIPGKDAPCDLILEKPFHGSRLYKLLIILQEFGGRNEVDPFDLRIQIMPGVVTGPIDSSDPLSHDIHLESSRPISKATHEQPLHGRNVLVVEDDPFLLRIALKILSKLGANAQFAENGEIALKLVREAFQSLASNHDRGEMEIVSKSFLYDVILMDCKMPIMDGFEATRQIRIEEKRYNIHVPIIAVSADTESEKGNQSIESGMNLHLTKPLTRELLLDAFQRIGLANSI